MVDAGQHVDFLIEVVAELEGALDGQHAPVRGLAAIHICEPPDTNAMLEPIRDALDLVEVVFLRVHRVRRDELLHRRLAPVARPPREPHRSQNHKQKAREKNTRHDRQRHDDLRSKHGNFNARVVRRAHRHGRREANLDVGNA